MIGNKIKALLYLKQKSTDDVCEHLDILQPAFSRKIKKNTFKSEELIQIAKLTNTRLAFIDNETNKELISFDENDIKENDN